MGSTRRLVNVCNATLGVSQVWIVHHVRVVPHMMIRFGTALMAVLALVAKQAKSRMHNVQRAMHALDNTRRTVASAPHVNVGPSQTHPPWRPCALVALKEETSSYHLQGLRASNA